MQILLGFCLIEDIERRETKGFTDIFGLLLVFT